MRREASWPGLRYEGEGGFCERDCDSTPFYALRRLECEESEEFPLVLSPCSHFLFVRIKPSFASVNSLRVLDRVRTQGPTGCVIAPPRRRRTVKEDRLKGGRGAAKGRRGKAEEEEVVEA